MDTGEFRLLSIWTRERLGSSPDASMLWRLGCNVVVTSRYGIAGPKGMEAEFLNVL